MIVTELVLVKSDKSNTYIFNDSGKLYHSDIDVYKTNISQPYDLYLVSSTNIVEGCLCLCDNTDVEVYHEPLAIHRYKRIVASALKVDDNIPVLSEDDLGLVMDRYNLRLHSTLNFSVSKNNSLCDIRLELEDYTQEEVEKLTYDAMKERDYTPYCVWQEWAKSNLKH